MKTFYLQDSRSYLGNSMVWWGKEGQGYTANVDLAREFTLEEAMAQHRIRHTDIPWPRDYICKHLQCTVDMQDVRRSHLSRYGIVLEEAPPNRGRRTLRCHFCGSFISDTREQFCKCPKCGKDNRP